jgi:hypothetical protein
MLFSIFHTSNVSIKNWFLGLKFNPQHKTQKGSSNGKSKKGSESTVSNQD